LVWWSGSFRWAGGFKNKGCHFARKFQRLLRVFGGVESHFQNFHFVHFSRFLLSVCLLLFPGALLMWWRHNHLAEAVAVHHAPAAAPKKAQLAFCAAAAKRDGA